MTHITLPRATVEQALVAMRFALHVGFNESSESQIKKADKASRQHWSAIRAIEAALAQQAEPVEPVAWRWGYRSVTTGEMDWRGYVEIAAHPNLRSPEIIMEPLYTAPPQRKPLTDEEIAAEWRKASECASKSEGAVTTSQFVQMFARAVERAHGINHSKPE